VIKKTGSMPIQFQIELVKHIRQPDIDPDQLRIALLKGKSSQDSYPLVLVSKWDDRIQDLTLPELSQLII